MLMKTSCEKQSLATIRQWFPQARLDPGAGGSVGWKKVRERAEGGRLTTRGKRIGGSMKGQQAGKEGMEERGKEIRREGGRQGLREEGWRP